MTSPLLQSVARIVLPPALLYGAYLFARGHNLPGGGFVSGLMVAGAFILQVVAADRKTVRESTPFHAAGLIPFGLGLALVTGLGSMALGFPFLTSAFGHLEIPLLGHFEASTAALFDLGVFFVVAGVALVILMTIEE